MSALIGLVAFAAYFAGYVALAEPERVDRRQAVRPVGHMRPVEQHDADDLAAEV